MSEVYNFQLVGVGKDVMFGKRGYSLKTTPSGMRLVDKDGNLVNLQFADGVNPNDGVTLQQLEDAISGVQAPDALEYKGVFDASAGDYSALADASEGDYYKISVAGVIDGVDWAVGDNLIINNDVTGTPTNTDVDKIDNTESPDILRTSDISTDNDLSVDPTKLAQRGTIKSAIDSATDRKRVAPFTYQNTSTNVTIGDAIPSGSIITEVRINVTTEFVGDNDPALIVIDNTNGSSTLVTPPDVDLTIGGLYKVSMYEKITQDYQYQISLSASNLTAGEAEVMIIFE